MVINVNRGIHAMKNKVRVTRHIVETEEYTTIPINDPFEEEEDTSNSMEFKRGTDPKPPLTSSAELPSSGNLHVRKQAIFEDNEIIKGMREHSPLIISQEEITMSAIPPKLSSYDALKIIAVSSIVAGGTGMAMMPIFNNLVKNMSIFGIDIHDNKIAFDLSTTNTFLVASFSSFVSMYDYIKKYKTISSKPDSLMVVFCKFGACCSLILPLELLWITELNDQKIGNSSGFDKFMAWATFSTLPLVSSQIIKAISEIDNTLEGNTKPSLPQSIGSKLITYGLPCVSLIGRALAFTEISKTLALRMGLSADAALGIGISTGGMVAASGQAILEYNTGRNLFNVDTKLTLPKLITGAVCLAEGIWFSLPLIAVGLTATTDWNPLLRGALFTPLLLSNASFEATNLHSNILNAYDYISDGITNLIGYCHDTESLEI